MKNGLTIPEIKIAWRGQEENILKTIGGLTAKNLSGKHQPCPMCCGTDRYRSVKKNGYITGEYHCGNGNNGDLLDHIEHVTGMSTADSITAIKGYLGLDAPDPAIQVRLQAKAKRMRDIAEFKAKSRQYNMKRDEELIEGLTELINTIDDRKYKLPADEEVKLAYKIIGIIVKRYMNMLNIRARFQKHWNKINGKS